jgi:hypothetical protein
MEQLPEVVIVLLLIGVDVDTTTELRRDILHSMSLLCRRLPIEPGDVIVRCRPWFQCSRNSLFLGELFGQEGVGSYEAPLYL